MMRIKRGLFHLLAFLSLFSLLSGCKLFKPTYPAIDPKTLTQDQQKTLASIEKIADHPLYLMKYQGDYSEFLKLKAKYFRELGLPAPKCSTFAALNPNGELVLGHNSDGDKRPLLLLFTNPPNGYASVSIIDIGENFGFTEKNTPLNSPMTTRTLLLYSPYFLNTGMNEMGLALAVMALPKVKADIDPGKNTMLANEARRYILDHCKNVEEAIEILSKNNLVYGSPNHMLMADRLGNSAVIEHINGKMVVIRNKENWQVATNVNNYGSENIIKDLTAEFQSSGKITKDANGRSYWRYLTAAEILKKMNGQLNLDQAMNLLKTISLKRSKDVWYDTQYSVAYNLSTGDLQLALDKNYGAILKYHLEIKK